MRASVFAFLHRLLPRRSASSGPLRGNGHVPYTREHPSPQYVRLLARYQSFHVKYRTMTGKKFLLNLSHITALVQETAATSVLDYGCGKGIQFAHPLVSALGASAHCTFAGYDPGIMRFATLPPGPFDGVTCLDVLEHIPEDDITWVLQELNSMARKFILLGISCMPSRKTFPNGDPFHVTIHPPEWWRERLTESISSELKLWVVFEEEDKGKTLEVLF